MLNITFQVLIRIIEMNAKGIIKINKLELFDGVVLSIMIKKELIWKIERLEVCLYDIAIPKNFPTEQIEIFFQARNFRVLTENPASWRALTVAWLFSTQ